MQNITFEPPAQFSHVFTASVVKHPEIWAEYMFIMFSVFSFFSGLLIGDMGLASVSLLIFSFFYWSLRTKKQVRKNPAILEASEHGVWFPHWKLFIPRENYLSIAEISERGYAPKVGPVTVRNLVISFEVSDNELVEIRRHLIWQLRWPTLIGRNTQTGNPVISLHLPYTTGRGSILDVSKEELLEMLQRLLSH